MMLPGWTHGAGWGAGALLTRDGETRRPATGFARQPPERPPVV